MARNVEHYHSFALKNKWKIYRCKQVTKGFIDDQLRNYFARQGVT